jgi:hypothetical protein
MVCLGPGEHEVRAGRLHDGGKVHHLLVGDVAIGEDAVAHVERADQLGQLCLGVDGDALGIELARQSGRVPAAVDVGDLGRGERHHATGGLVAIHPVEVVEITAGGADDDHIFPLHARSSPIN